MYLLRYRSFSRYYLKYQACPCHVRLSSSCPPVLVEHSVPPPTVHILAPPCGLYAGLRCHKGRSVCLLPSPPRYWYKYSTITFFLTGSGPLRENVFSAFSRRLLGRANTFLSPSFFSTPVNISNSSYSFTLFLSATRSNPFVLYYTFVLYPTIPHQLVCVELALLRFLLGPPILF